MKSITEVVQNLLKPYIDRNIETATGELGAKNLLPSKAGSEVVEGITYATQADGTILVSGSTSGANSWHTIAEFTLAKGKYKFTGCPSGGSSSTYEVVITIDGNNYFDFGNGYSFELSSQKTVLVRIRVSYNYTLSATLTFYPMIRPASIVDDTYAPYAMTNRQLTVIEQLYTYDEITGTTNVDGLLTIATASQRTPIFAVPVTAQVTVTGIYLNQYGIYYAKTDKISSEVTLGVFRKTKS